MTGKTMAIVLIAVLAGALVLGAGLWIGRTLWSASPLYAGPWGRIGGAYRTGPGFTGGWDRGGSRIGPGMMGGGFRGGPGMMGRSGAWAYTSGEPLSIEEAREAVETYLRRFGYSELQVGEVMIFDNHAYAEVVEADTGEGAFEVLIDHATGAVHLEYGPAMMWNTQYGMMGGGGMMGGWVPQQGTAAEPGVTAGEARRIAQDYLEQYQPELSVGDEVGAFPGYYTIHTLKDGEVFGMLSVNAYTGQVWVHTWHGRFIEMTE
jgi:hypothetical protein